MALGARLVDLVAECVLMPVRSSPGVPTQLPLELA
jgi:hypothetical protein